MTSMGDFGDSARKYIIFFVKSAVAVLAFWLIFNKVNYRNALDVLGRADLTLVGLAVFVMYFRHIASVLRMRTLLGSRGHVTTLPRLLRLDYVGIFFNLFLPTSVGGDVVRAYYFYRDGARKRVAVSSILIERSMGVLALASLAVPGVAYYYLDSGIEADTRLLAMSGAVCLTVIAAILSLYIGSGRIVRAFGTEARMHKPLFIFLDEVSAFSGSRGIWLHTYLTSAAFQFLAVVVMWMLARALGDQTHVIYFMFVPPVVWILSMLPVSPAGLGVREGAFIYLFTRAGMQAETAAAVAMLFLFIFLSQAMVGGLLYVLGGQRLGGAKVTLED